MSESGGSGVAHVPSCDPATVLSNSAWSGMRSCEWKSVFSRDPITRSLSRGTIHSAVGNARHAVEEEVHEGTVAGRSRPSRDWVQQRFASLLEEEAAKLREAWKPAVVPPVRAWPNITRVRMALGRRLGSPADGSIRDPDWPPPDTPRSKKGAPPQAMDWAPPQLMPNEALSEAWLLDDARGLRGQIDLLARDQAGCYLVTDYKSGIGASDEELVRRHRTQMLFYAGLVQACYGDWPKLTVDPATSPSVALAYTPDDVHELRDAVESSRSHFNENLQRQTLRVEPAVSDSPCLWCPFRVVCPVLQEAWPSIAAAVPAAATRALSLALGSVRAVSRQGSGTQVEVYQERSLTAPAGDVTVTRLPEDLDVSEGDFIAVAGLESLGSTVLRADWNSIVHVVPARVNGS